MREGEGARKEIQIFLALKSSIGAEFYSIELINNYLNKIANRHFDKFQFE